MDQRSPEMDPLNEISPVLAYLLAAVIVIVTVASMMCPRRKATTAQVLRCSRCGATFSDDESFDDEVIG